MTVENILLSISTKECCQPRRGLNQRPPGLQSDGASNWATEAGPHVRRYVLSNCGLYSTYTGRDTIEATREYRMFCYWRNNLSSLCNSRKDAKPSLMLDDIGKMPASVAQLDAPSDWRPGGRGFNPRRGRQHSFVEIDHEIFSTVILSLPLIQEGQLSVSGERMCTIPVNRLED